MFFDVQSESQKREYTELLKVVGSLSHLFSESPVPYLYYRAAENIFCRAFDAENLSRGDVSADASKDKVGIGLKTFLHKNGATFQKVAEFNKGMYEYHTKDPRDIVENISSQRNKRIEFTTRAYGVDQMIYHLVTREEGVFKLYEENMDSVDLNSIKAIKQKNNIIYFRDRYHGYKFNLSKSTLFKQFITAEPIYQFEVQILEDPYSFLLLNAGAELESISEPEETYEHIYLPLYSVRDGDVQRKGGLNQWNAAGRSRHEDELYISVPMWIHKDFPDFFPYDLNEYREKKGRGEKYSGEHFTLELPDGSKLSAKICQENGKALMSNPNKALGNWLLRRVLQIPPGTLVTYAMLEEIGIDSVVVTKLSKDYFRIDFAKIGSYAEFEDEYKS